MTDGGSASRPSEEQIVIPDGTPFVIVDLDTENERVQVELTLGGRVLRTWVPAADFEQMIRN